MQQAVKKLWKKPTVHYLPGIMALSRLKALHSLSGVFRVSYAYNYMMLQNSMRQ